LGSRHGLKFLDGWAFIRPHSGSPFPVRWRRTRDFGTSALGYNPDDADYAGRRIDVLGRAINIGDGETAVAALRRYLAGKRPRTVPHLAKRP